MYFLNFAKSKATVNKKLVSAPHTYLGMRAGISLLLVISFGVIEPSKDSNCYTKIQNVAEI